MKKMRLFVNLNLLGQLKLDSVLNFMATRYNNFSFEKRRQVTMKVYSRDFINEYSKRLNGMQGKKNESVYKSCWIILLHLMD